jgi:hypothetical protein
MMTVIDCRKGIHLPNNKHTNKLNVFGNKLFCYTAVHLI